MKMRRGGHAVAGATLVEVLIAGGVSLMLFGLVTFLLSSVSRAGARQRLSVELQQQMMVIMSHLDGDLRACTQGGVSIRPADAGSPLVVVGLHRLDAGTFSGARVWQDHAIVWAFDPDTHRLVRKSYPPAPPSLSVAFTTDAAVLLTGPDLLAIAEQTNGTEVVMSGRARSFNVEPAGGGACYAVSVGLEGAMDGSQETTRLDLARTIHLRNGQ